MIPIKLELEAFGPFLDKQVIDFTEFENDKIFLISGKTGSGKTSIFDAICFSLYGVASGNIRDSDSFKSDFAESSRVCFVELEFIIHGKNYTVRREPIQFKLKRNGNLVKENSNALLTCDGISISGVSTVDTKIEELLGLNADQFKKIVMLPQGEFRKFLSDDSNEKQKTLRKIFSTNILDDFTEQLKVNAFKLRKELEEHSTLLTAHIGNIKPCSNQELLLAMDSKSQDVPAILKLLNESNDEYTTKIDGYKESLLKLNKQKDSINLPYAKEINSKFTLLEESKNSLTSLFTNKPYFDKLSKQIEILKAIKEIATFETSINEYILQEKDVKNKIADYKLQSDKNETLLIKANQAYTTAKKEQENLPSLTMNIEEKKQLLLKIEKYNSLQAEQIMHKNLIQKQQKNLNEYQLSNEYVVLTTEKTEITKKLSSINKIYDEIIRCRTATDEFLVATNSYKFAMNSFIESQAFFLAGSLKNNLPCPVCGSLEHPSPAKGTDNPISKEQLDNEKQHYDEASRHLKEQQTICKQLLINEEFDIASHSKLSEFLPELTQKRTEYECKINECHQKAVTLQTKIPRSLLNATIQGLTDKINAIKTDIALSNHNCVLLQKSLAELEYLNGMNKENISSEITSLTQKLNKIRNSFDTASTAQEELSAKSAHFKEAIYQLGCVSEQVSQNLIAKESEFKIKLKEANININDYNSQKNLIPNLKQFEKSFYEYNNDISQKQAVIMSLTAQLEGLSPVNVNALQQKYDETILLIDDETSKLSSAVLILSNNCDSYKKIFQTHKTFEKISKKFNEYQRFYDIANGKFSDKINFERYALAGYFNDVIQNANIRLEQMTNSRYTLNRRVDKEKGNKSSGLSLEVFDAYTGKARHVNTLSGGESFKISLCLALGLADITSQNSGGIELNTMFIDEGFGSLDATSLDSAIECLMDLRESGRYIGVISHVSELKDKIPSKLFVEQTPHGSYIKLQE